MKKKIIEENTQKRLKGAKQEKKIRPVIVLRCKTEKYKQIFEANEQFFIFIFKIFNRVTAF
jgi:hypothetical protein